MELVKLLTADEICGFFDKPGDSGDFVLDLKAAREERAEELLRKHWMKERKEQD
ncbi:hypothetical protein [Alicyclobacillus acidoterrestris]|uniref:Uncharacterized protein n=1 Tax=Alicyclobacillus acidoterrestris (strain ATCC 49025 / DSM 3922 / CIP 106132 / NCIMB 13137 / GD3B) TaxID=1356854 RepID=T0BVN1_ALIAG|nr:hypothetical protein [Alicyclobacillus acidoterrestris]EPZ44475.1 hypothetical protein N007_10955 [Alicyclobacillus acidoterrestris ATCC 49025]UNO49352.1 hypothetical protein K1I37_02000 [Alicyclobacillus acidoterrestris]